jgi:hypothetical protein
MSSFDSGEFEAFKTEMVANSASNTDLRGDLPEAFLRALALHYASRAVSARHVD